ncbi:1,2-phenylacetyl-CoA epoxidase subunit PaaD [Chryseolinea lacunae]|uniref:Phenylacetate-CoA oxygenase subunit PaaJ n=1 Tax=Chryseolinea lacunae TaxID=2801331 RepID=A0ABS1KVW7_9BACT|nr:1,2-phenylacetyl-CoA epoxidase subunit PaaD [Chryseolinea lacunae]MBL0742807.1 phenylacetate-CoA oxygenase subunit PaaJ [Chryseolinea lacunae]
MNTMTQRDIYHWLETVKDPEIPVLSLVDLGVITGVTVDNDRVAVEMTPTFVGCPALDMMKHEITEVLTQHGAKAVTITVNFRDPWSSDKISEKGRAALKQFGLAPPPQAQLVTDLEVLEHVPCPRCEGTHTALKNTFGPTLCRSIHYCYDCKEAFEQFKPL